MTIHWKPRDGINKRKGVSRSTNDFWDPKALLPRATNNHAINLKGNRSRFGFLSRLSWWKFLSTRRLLKDNLPIIFGICFFLCIVTSVYKNNQHKKMQARPMMIGCYFSTESDYIMKVKHLLVHDEDRYPSKRQVNWTTHSDEMEKTLRNSIKYNRARAEEIENPQCTLPYKWQRTSNPTCNTIHENDMSLFFNEGRKKVAERLYLLDHGYFRDIWVFKAGYKEYKPTVVKTLRHVHEVTERNFERHRRDALLMSHLGSKSTSRIADIYSFCGNSIFSEFAEKGTVSDIIWPLNGSNCTISSTERLQLAFKIANAVSDAHNYDADGVATVAHTDITPSQFLVFQGGLIKLNDFNRCRFLKRDNGQICPYKVSHNPGKFRSPEEYSYGNQSEMVDIYSMGNVFYSILSEKWPFEDIDNTKVVQEKITNGERPLTKYFEKDKASVMLSEVIDLCWKQNPEERPSARDVALLLKRKIEKL